MTLQSSGAISLANVQTEFGGSNPISISEYYGAASGVPTSGQISLSDFYGKSASVGLLGTFGGAISGTSNVGSITFTAPAGTKSVIVTSVRNVNRSRVTTVSSVVVGGTTATNAVTYQRTGSEYNTTCAVYAVNKTYSSATSVTATVTWGGTSSANYGKIVRIYCLDKAFNSYTPSSSGGSAAGNASWTSYTGGFAAGCACRNSPPTSTLGSDTYNYTAFEPDYHSSSEVITSGGTESISGGGANTSYGRYVTAGCSWALSKFS